MSMDQMTRNFGSFCTLTMPQKPGIPQHFTKLKNSFLTWATLNTKFEKRYHSEIKRALVCIQLKAIRFSKYQNKERIDSEAFEEMVADLEKLRSLAHEESNSNHSLCDFRRPAVEGEEWALHAQFKS